MVINDQLKTKDSVLVKKERHNFERGNFICYIVSCPFSFVDTWLEITVPKLILVRHALPHIAPDIPASHWALSDEGRQGAEHLAPLLKAYQPQRIITSTEKKAMQTGQIIAEQLGIGCATAPDLHEHDRRNERFEVSRAVFEQRVRDFFAQPDELIFGTETASDAYNRFALAVQNELNTNPGETLAIVTHGTTMTLFTAYHNDIIAFDFWKQLQQPDFKVYTLPDFQLADA